MTTLANRVISVFNKKTSMRLTKIEWFILDSICLNEHIKRKKLLELIESNKDPKLGLTPSVRLFTVLYLYASKSNNNFNSQSNENILSTINSMANC